MKGFTIEQQPKPATPGVKPDFSQKIKGVFDVIEFSNEELVEVFDKKYENSDADIVLYDGMANGKENPARDSEGKLIFKNPKDFSSEEKILNMKVLVEKFKNNMVDYTKELSKESALLEKADEKFSFYKQLKDIPEEPEETLRVMVEQEIKNNN